MSMFKIGTVLTGKHNNSYAITNSNALCMVIGNSTFSSDGNPEQFADDEALLLVVARKNTEKEIGEIYPVCTTDFDVVPNLNIYDCIEHRADYNFIDKETLESILYEHWIKFNETTQEFETFIPDFTVNNVNESQFDVDVSLTKEEKDALINDVYEYLKSFGYQSKISGTTEVIDKWLKQKRKLINMFKNHPNYNGKFQIVTEGEFDKRIDTGILNEFSKWVGKLDINDLYYEPVKIGMFTYEEARNSYLKLKKFIDLFIDEKVYFINGNRQDFYSEQFNFFKTILDKYRNNPDVVIVECNAYKKEKYSKMLYFNIALDFLREKTVAYYTTDYHVNLCNKYLAKDEVKLNTPMTEVLELLFEKAGVNTLPGFEEEFSKIKYTLTPGKEQYHTVLSVHPIDYLSMGHGKSWMSSESIDKIYNINKEFLNTGYCGATLSYMLDTNSMVYYTVHKSYEGTELEKELKSHRNIFHYHDSRLLQDKMYPLEVNNTKSDVFEGSRHIVQNIISTCLNTENKWVLKRGYDNYRKCIGINGKTERDSLGSDNINVSILKSAMTFNHEKIMIGAPGICFNCGKEFIDGSSILCRTHKNPKVRCKTCGKSYVSENCNYIYGNTNPEEDGWYCKHHSFFCSKHKKFEIGQPAKKTWNGESCGQLDNTAKVTLTYDDGRELNFNADSVTIDYVDDDDVVGSSYYTNLYDAI